MSGQIYISGRTGISVPTTAVPAGFEDPNGNLANAKVDSLGNLLISGTISASNPSVGLNGAAIPTSATLIGVEDGSGNLQPASAANPVPVSGTFSAGEATKDDTGTASSAAVILTQADTTGYYSCFFQIAGIGTSTVIAEINNNGTWVTQTVENIASRGPLTSVIANGIYQAETGGLGFRLRVSVYDGTATISANAFFRGFPIPQPLQTTVAATQSGTWNVTNISGTVSLPTGAATSALQTTGNTALTTINTTLGSPFQAGGSIGNTSFIANGATTSGSPLTSSPVTIGGRAATTNPTAVADGQVVNTMHDKLGKLVAVGAVRILKGSQKTTISNTTSETTIITQVASTFLDLYGIIFANTGVTTTKVDIRDTTGGAIIATIEVPTLETRGFTFPVDSAIPQTAVNTNWTAQCAAATTAMEVTAFWVKNT